MVIDKSHGSGDEDARKRIDRKALEFTNSVTGGRTFVVPMQYASVMSYEKG